MQGVIIIVALQQRVFAFFQQQEGTGWPFATSFSIVVISVLLMANEEDRETWKFNASRETDASFLWTTRWLLSPSLM